VDWQQGEDTKLEGLDPLWVLNHYHYLDNKKNGKGVLYKNDGNKQAGIWEDDEQCKSLDFKDLNNNKINNVYQNRLNNNKLKV
ncbi:MAG: hypothetical protein E7C54_12650, partial [Clostridioides difficile]|nr:hypothetical protein [Clostridioides difficile]